MESKPLKIVYAITERGEKSYWTRIGIAHINRDGSLNIRLDAVPIGGVMQVRDWTPREEQPAGDTRGKRNNGSRDEAVGMLDDLPEVMG